jgi:hypothetical protein
VVWAKWTGLEREMTERDGRRTIHLHNHFLAIWHEFSESASRVRNQREGLGALGCCSSNQQYLNSDSLTRHCQATPRLLKYFGMRRLSRASVGCQALPRSAANENERLDFARFHKKPTEMLKKRDRCQQIGGIVFFPYLPRCFCAVCCHSCERDLL